MQGGIGTATNWGIDDEMYTTAKRHGDAYAHRVREVHCQMPCSFTARCIASPSDRQKSDADPSVDDDMIRLIPAVGTGGVTRRPPARILHRREAPNGPRAKQSRFRTTDEPSKPISSYENTVGQCLCLPSAISRSPYPWTPLTSHEAQ